MAILIGMSGALKGQRYEIERDEFFVGRNTNNDIIADDPAVSGQHFCITRSGREYTLCDLGSTNGTRLNGQQVNRSRLKPKDIIQIGALEIMFDGTDVDVEETVGDQPRVEVVSGVPVAPPALGGVSPFGARKDSRTAWIWLMVVLGLFVVVALVFFVIRIRNV